MQPKLPYETSLDGIRAVAVCMVIAYHLLPKAFPWGWIGVHLFFVLSGYLITRLLMKEIEQTETVDLARFYLRRALRLMPALWLMLLAFLPFILAGHHSKPQLESWAMAASYLMNFNAAFGWTPMEAFTHTWSLATEQQFYLLWPAALLLGVRYRPKAILTGLLIASMAWRAYLYLHGASIDRIYYSPDTDSDALILGCLLAVSRLSQVWVRRLALIWPIWLAVIGAAILYLAKLPAAIGVMLGVDLVSLLGVLLIISAPLSSLGQFLSIPPLRFVGKISYGWYLWHLPLIEFMRMRWHLTGWQLLIPVAASFAAAVLSYFTVEAWARGVKDHPPLIPRRTMRSHELGGFL